MPNMHQKKEGVKGKPNLKRKKKWRIPLNCYAGDPLNVLPRMMKADRDLIIHTLAMNMMKGDLTPEQQDYKNTLETVGKEFLGTEEAPESWEKNEDVLAHLNEVLTESQKEELQIYLDEQVTRKTERRALRRTNELSDKLGLNEVDRSALYDYLYENQKATQEDIAEQFSPELTGHRIRH